MIPFEVNFVHFLSLQEVSAHIHSHGIEKETEIWMVDILLGSGDQKILDQTDTINLMETLTTYEFKL